MEIKGKIKSIELLKSPLDEKDCAGYFYLVEKQVRRGKSTSWVKEFEERNFNNFYVEDEHSKILINPFNADMKLKKKVIKDRLKEGIVTNIYRYTECVLEEATPLYILGTANISTNLENNLIISKTKDKDFIITDETEEKLSEKFLFSFLLNGFIGFYLLFFVIIQIFNILDWMFFLGDLL